MSAVSKPSALTATTRYAVMLCFVLLFGGKVLGQSAPEVFENGNKLYEQQKYTAAAAEYEKLLQTSNTSATVYYNLGNAYFKAGQLGRAIAAYRRAGNLAPRDPNVRANLQFARNEANSKVSPGVWDQWVNQFTINEWAIAAAICLWLFFGLLIAAQWRSDLKRTLRLWSGFSGAAGVFVIICLLFAVQNRLYTTSAVVVTQEAVARRGPFDESQSYFTLRDGAEILVLDRKDKWLQIADASRRTGWLPESQVIVLNGGQ